MSIITATQVKNFGNIDFDTSDSIITDILIPGAEAWVESHLDCKLSVQSISAEIVDGFGFSLWPKVKPITALATDTAVYDSWTAEYVTGILFTTTRLYQPKEVHFNAGAKRFSLTYTAGYSTDTCPINIKMALLMLVNRALLNPSAKSRQAANGFGFSWENLANTDIISLLENETFKGVLD